MRASDARSDGRAGPDGRGNATVVAESRSADEPSSIPALRQHREAAAVERPKHIEVPVIEGATCRRDSPAVNPSVRIETVGNLTADPALRHGRYRPGAARFDMVHAVTRRRG